MNTGWIKLHRKILEEGWLKNQKLLPVLLYCLLKASHTHHSFTVGNQKVKLKRGQFVFGRKSAAIELGMSEGSIIRRMENLKKMEIVITEPNNKFTLVTVCNWEIYQSDKSSNRSSNRSVTDQQPINKQVHNRSTTDHKQECKNVKKGENEKNGRSNATVFETPEGIEEEEPKADNDNSSSHSTATEGEGSSKPDDLMSRDQTRLERSVAQPIDVEDLVNDYEERSQNIKPKSDKEILEEKMYYWHFDEWEDFLEVQTAKSKILSENEIDDFIKDGDFVQAQLNADKVPKNLTYTQRIECNNRLNRLLKTTHGKLSNDEPKPEKPMDMAEQFEVAFEKNNV